MKRIVSIILISIIVFSSCKNNNNKSESNNKKQNSTESLEFLKDFDGKYPYEIDLFKQKTLTDRIKSLVGDKYDFIETNWNVETPIIANDILFFASACMQHNCDATNFLIVYYFDADILYVGIRDEYKTETFSEDGSSCEEISEWESGNF
jgi:hypothetical protein